MMNCRGMGAVTKKGNKPQVMAKGKKVPGKIKGYAMGSPARLDPSEFELASTAANRAARVNQAMKRGPRMAKGKTVKRKMKGKKVY